MLTILSTASVVTVYAVLIGTFTGGSVTIGGSAAGTVYYSEDQSTWTTTLSPSSPAASWYTKLTVDGGQYSGSAVTVTWQLQRQISESTWSNVGSTTVTSMTLAAGSNDIFATANGLSTNNRDWGVDVTEEGTYRVEAVINSA
jgi:hypothetical protein